jgi:hypothetical protein
LFSLSGYTVDIKVNPFSLSQIPMAAAAAASSSHGNSSHGKVLTTPVAYSKVAVEVDGV